VRCLSRRNCSKVGYLKGSLKEGMFGAKWWKEWCSMTDGAFSAPHPIGNRGNNHAPAIGKKFWGHQFRQKNLGFRVGRGKERIGCCKMWMIELRHFFLL